MPFSSASALGNISPAMTGSTLGFQCGLSCGSASEGVARPMKRATFCASMACTMVRVPSVTGVPVVDRFREGPSALMTASAPLTACSTALGSDSCPVTAVRSGWARASLAGVRTRAVTWWPSSKSCWTTRRPMAPVAPKTVTCMRCPVCEVGVGWSGGGGGGDFFGVAVDRVGHGGAGKATPVDLAEESVQADGLVGVEDLLDELLAGADHDRVTAPGSGVELCLVDDEAATSGRLGAQVLVVVRESLAGGLRGGGGVEVGGD